MGEIGDNLLPSGLFAPLMDIYTGYCRNVQLHFAHRNRGRPLLLQFILDWICDI